MLFATDRYLSFIKNWRSYYKYNDIIIFDRYVASNIVHQGAKINDEEELRKYINWEIDFEYFKLGLPVPDVTLFLDMSPEASESLRQNRSNKSNGSKKLDIHERDKIYMNKCYYLYKQLAEELSWITIGCDHFSRIRHGSEIYPKIVITSKILDALCSTELSTLKLKKSQNDTDQMERFDDLL